MKLAEKEIVFNSEKQIELECLVECGNPQIFEYTWLSKNNTELFKSTITNKYTYNINAETISDELWCQVTNSINTQNKKESQTKFSIRKFNPNVPSANSTGEYKKI